jgi:hypothetical protein
VERSPAPATREWRRANIIQILGEASLDLRQRLGVGIEMVDAYPALAEHQRTAIAPPGNLGNEVGWRGQLDVYSQPLLQRRKLAQQIVAFGLEAHIDVERRVAPSL